MRVYGYRAGQVRAGSCGCVMVYEATIVMQHVDVVPLLGAKEMVNGIC